MAYEQYHCSSDDSYVNDYIVIMTQLLKTEKHENLLVRLGIAENWLENDMSIKNCFQKLLQETYISVDDFYFSGIVEMLDDCYKGNKWEKQLQEWKLVYFTDPWTIIAVIQAVILLWLTVVQTVLYHIVVVCVLKTIVV
ncbi:hypothetical protein M5689_007020 [Euphorbia peplus]|nr:hypothetical protein M5689_007020 [Euphorbia peplus]